MKDVAEVSGLEAVYTLIDTQHPELDIKRTIWFSKAIKECLKYGAEVQEIVDSILRWYEKGMQEYQDQNPLTEEKESIWAEKEFKTIKRDNPDIILDTSSHLVNDIVFSADEWDIFLFVLKKRGELIPLNTFLESFQTKLWSSREEVRRILGKQIQSINQKLSTKYPDISIKTSVQWVKIDAIDPEYISKYMIQWTELIFLSRQSKIVISWEEKILSPEESIVLWMFLWNLNTDGIRENKIKSYSWVLESLAWKLSPIIISWGNKKYFINK